MTFTITEQPAPYCDYARALKIKMQQRKRVQRLAAKHVNTDAARRELVITTTALLLLECDLMDAIEGGRG